MEEGNIFPRKNVPDAWVDLGTAANEVDKLLTEVLRAVVPNSENSYLDRILVCGILNHFKRKY